MSLFPATLISGVHLYWGLQGASSRFTSVTELKAAPDGKPCCWLSTYFPLYISPHLSFTSILSLTHDMFVLSFSLHCLLFSFSSTLSGFCALSSEEGKEREEGSKNEEDSTGARDCQSVCSTQQVMILSIFHHDKGCRGVNTGRDCRNVRIDEWLKRREGVIKDRAECTKKIGDVWLGRATIKQNWTPVLLAWSILNCRN